MRIGIFTPFHISEEKDVSMFFYHRRLRRTMARMMTAMGHELVGIGTIDKDATRTFPKNPQYPEFQAIGDLRDKPADGIVRPTKWAIKTAEKLGVDILVRTGQDMIVTNPDIACEQILATEPGTLAGSADECGNIRQHLRDLGIKQKGNKYRFVQGNWMQAYLDVWRENYLRLPPKVKHYCDDSVFSYLVEKDRGGRLVFTPGNRIIHKHRRNEPAKFFDDQLADPGMTPSKRELDTLVLYRFHSKNAGETEFKLRFLKSFTRGYEAFAKERGIEPRFCFIPDNTPSVEVAKCEQVVGQMNAEIIPTESKKQDERLKGGKTCTPKHYTLYITSMNCARRLATEKTVVFFVEDDYLFRPDAFEKICRFLQDHSEDFVAPLDHPDRYEDTRRLKEMTNHYDPYRLELVWEQSHHWRTCVSTCHTFAGTLKGLVLNDHILLSADQQRGDHTMWCDLWRHGKSKLWSPIPGLASHRCGPHLEDWNWNQLLMGAALSRATESTTSE